MDSLRQSLKNLGDAQAQSQQDRNPNDGQASNQTAPQGQRDPLGRDTGEGTQMGSDRSLLQGQDVYRRAQELLDEIRKRAGQQTRPDKERSYLKRLLDLF